MADSLHHLVSRTNPTGRARFRLSWEAGFLSIFHIPYGTILVWITDSSSYGSLFHTYGIQEMTSSILYHFRIRKSAHCLAHLSARLESLMPGFVRLIVRLPSSYIDPGYVSPCTRKESKDTLWLGGHGMLISMVILERRYCS